VLSWLLLLPAATPALWFAQLLFVTPPTVVLFAVGPVVGYAAVVLLFGYRQRISPGLALAVFLWGAIVAAYAALVLNGWIEGTLASLTTAQQARTITPAVGAPIVEETAKAVVLAVLAHLGRRPLGTMLDGIIYGALVGLGFELTENVNYLTMDAIFKGPDLLPRSAYLRGIVGGLDHALFAATAGAGFGFVREHRTAAPLLASAAGVLAAIGQHVLWNVVAAPQINALLCNPDPATGSCQPAPAALDLFVTVPLVVALSLGPGVVLLVVCVRVARRRGAIASRRHAESL
jgi:RsiW-degrading membrane proteinase PrsW (M82 family)